jgi:hypothetical protein
MREREIGGKVERRGEGVTFSGEVETPDKTLYFPSFTLDPLLGSWGKT